MKHNWKTYRLGDFLERQYDSVTVEDFSKYKRITIKTKGQGIELRDEVEGLEIGTKNQFKVKANQFLLSKIDAMNGAFGIVPEECNEGIITGNFWTYNLDDKIIKREYLRLLCFKQVFTEFSIEASEGTTNRKYLRENKFLNLSIPLPPLAEQQHIIAKIESIKNKIEEALRLKKEVIEETKLLGNNYVSEIFENAKSIYGSTTIKNSIIDVNKSTTNPEYKFGNSEFIYIDVGSVEQETSKVLERKKIIGTEAPSRARRLMKLNNIVFGAVRPNLKKSFIVDEDLDENICSTGFTIFNFDENKINPKFLLEQLLSDFFINQCMQVVTGGHYPAINNKQLSQLEIVIPPMQIQEKIATQIENFKSKLNAAKTHHSSTQTELAQLLPSLLDKAFKGESFANVLVQPKTAKVIALPKLQEQEEKLFLKRKVLATYIINQSLNDAKFGDVKFAKLLHLSDYFAIKRNLGQNYFQQAAGPYDNTFTHAYFQQVLNAKWFNRNKKGNQFVFSAGQNHNKSTNIYGFFSDEELNRVNEIINYFKSSDYEQPEIVSTLYAVWNNRIVCQQENSDNLLIEDFYNWDEQKKKYDRNRLEKALQWMRDKNFVPDGWGKIIEKSKVKTRKAKK